MWISRAVDPGAVVQAGRIDDQRVIPLPVADRVSVIPRIGRAFLRAASVLGKLSSVHPDFAPSLLILIENNDAVGHGRERNTPDLVHVASREAKRITGAERII